GAPAQVSVAPLGGGGPAPSDDYRSAGKASRLDPPRQDPVDLGQARGGHPHLGRRLGGQTVCRRVTAEEKERSEKRREHCYKVTERAFGYGCARRMPVLPLDIRLQVSKCSWHGRWDTQDVRTH